ncbi:MAG: hypothetical protein QM648_06150 [Solirubrobacterales bacterium]
MKLASSLASKLTYANVVATLALFIALGGVSYAAVKLPANSVGEKQLKNKAVTLKKIDPKAKAALKGQKGADGAAGAKGETGARGSDGTDGVDGIDGATGATGPSDLYRTAAASGDTAFDENLTTIASLDLPAGDYLLLATGQVSNTRVPASTSRYAECLLMDGASYLRNQYAFTGPFYSTNLVTSTAVTQAIAMQRAISLGDATTISVRCYSVGGQMGATIDLSAIKVGAIHD